MPDAPRPVAPAALQNRSSIKLPPEVVRYHTDGTTVARPKRDNCRRGEE
jgi:hypothetical protein